MDDSPPYEPSGSHKPPTSAPSSSPMPSTAHDHATPEKRSPEKRSVGPTSKAVAKAVHDRLGVDQAWMERRLDFSHFDLNAILRGGQIAVVGTARALREKPSPFSQQFYLHAALTVAVSLVLHLLAALPVYLAHGSLGLLSFVFRSDLAQWQAAVTYAHSFVQNYLLQVPFFLIALFGYLSPTLDDVFLASLRFTDHYYQQKHQGDQASPSSSSSSSLRPLYYPNLSTYPKYPKQGTRQHDDQNGQPVEKHPHRSKPTDTIVPDSPYGMMFSVVGKLMHTSSLAYLRRYTKKMAVAVGVYAASQLPFVGRFVLPAVSFLTFKRAVGLGPATAIFAASTLFLPERWLVLFLQAYFWSRSLMRELLEPYFARVPMTAAQKRVWFRNREGVLFGFALLFYPLIRLPLVGLVFYGLAQSATAFLVTKITDPPPVWSEREAYAASQTVWHNRHAVLEQSLAHLDDFFGQRREPCAET